MAIPTASFGGAEVISARNRVFLYWSKVNETEIYRKGRKDFSCIFFAPFALFAVSQV